MYVDYKLQETSGHEEQILQIYEYACCILFYMYFALYTHVHMWFDATSTFLSTVCMSQACHMCATCVLFKLWVICTISILATDVKMPFITKQQLCLYVQKCTNYNQ